MMKTLALLVLSLTAVSTAAATQPIVGQRPPDFKVFTPEGKIVQLTQVMATGPVVLVVLRGYPGYQMPVLQPSSQDFIANAQRFSEIGARAVLVYAGPPDDLKGRANEFLVGKNLQAGSDLVLDPGYTFTNEYGLRWDAQGEAAYPSVFLIDRSGVILFTKTVKEHGCRTTAAETIEAMPKRGK